MEAEILQIKGIAALDHDVRDEALIRFVLQRRLEEQLANQAGGALGNRSFPTVEVGIVLMREDGRASRSAQVPVELAAHVSRRSQRAPRGLLQYFTAFVLASDEPAWKIPNVDR
jgi:hypothetical protein